MTRALAVSLVVLASIAVLARAARADKPKIAVLGFEVAPGPGGALDPGAQLIAREITKELRQRVASPSCPYAVAPNSNKELLDEKQLMSCETEALDCMIVMAAGLASDALLYGRVEKRGDGFRIAVKLLDARRKLVQPATDELAGGGGGGVPGVSRRLYRKLIGDAPSGDGKLVIKVRTESGAAIRGGTVVVDDEPRGQLVGGKLTVSGISDGRHSVAIVAGGFQRFEEIVTLHVGEHAAIDALLRPQTAGAPVVAAASPATALPAGAGPAAGPEAVVPAAPTRTPRIDPTRDATRGGVNAPGLPGAEGAGRPPIYAGQATLVWKVSLVAGTAAAIGGGALAWYSYERQQANAANILARAEKGSVLDNDYCGSGDADLVMRFPGIDLNSLHRTCSWHTRTYLGYGIAAIGVVAAVTSLILLSRDPPPGDSAATGGRGKRGEVAIGPLVQPLIGPGLAGAQLAIGW